MDGQITDVRKDTLQMDKVGKSLLKKKKKNGLTKSREMIKSVGQTACHGAVKGYVNNSVSLHICHAEGSLSSGLLPPSPRLKRGSRVLL